jgi:hypothetical protein
MRWIAKAAAQNLFAVIPGGNRINRLLQGDVFAHLVPGHIRHLEKIRKVLPPDVKVAVEIGTGWCPTVPLGLTADGIVVHTYDRARHATAESIRACQGAVGGDWALVHYHAPGDATATSLPDASVDLHFSLAVLEHVPAQVIPAFFTEAHRILRPGGLLYHEIDLRDHFADFDPSITPVNFLKFNDFQWKCIGQNSIHFHNRLRASDFLRMFESCGFELVDVATITDERAAKALSRMKIADRFQRYEKSDLITSVLTVVARKKADSNSGSSTE